MYICILYRLASVGHIPSVFLCQWDHGKIGKDYEMHAICLWAPLDSVQQRGNQRSLKACAMSTPCLRHAQCGDLEWFQIYGRPGKFSTKNGSSERLVLQCLKYPSSQQLELLQGDMYIYIYVHVYMYWLVIPVEFVQLKVWEHVSPQSHRPTGSPTWPGWKSIYSEISHAKLTLGSTLLRCWKDCIKSAGTCYFLEFSIKTKNRFRGKWQFTPY